MKVNVLGKGLIPGLKAIAPIKNVEATQEQVAKIIKVRTLKVFVADDTLTQITSDNIDAIFNPGVALAEEAKKEEAAKKEEVKKPKKSKKESKVEEVIEKAIENDIPVEVETPDEEAAKEEIPLQVGIKEYTGELSKYSSSQIPEFANEEAPAEEAADDEPVAETVEEDPAEETVTEEEAPKSYTKKNKKNRNK